MMGFPTRAIFFLFAAMNEVKVDGFKMMICM